MISGCSEVNSARFPFKHKSQSKFSFAKPIRAILTFEIIERFLLTIIFIRFAVNKLVQWNQKHNNRGASLSPTPVFKILIIVIDKKNSGIIMSRNITLPNNSDNLLSPYNLSGVLLRKIKTWFFGKGPEKNKSEGQG